MDIQDIELVVLYGAPDNMNHLHQVQLFYYLVNLITRYYVLVVW